MSQVILCPKCQQRNWSSDYWTCSSCGYEKTRESVLLEENKDFQESYNRGDNPTLNLGFWTKEQKSLCREMVDYLLPNHNYKLSFEKPERNEWGWTKYRENDKAKAEQAKSRLRETGHLIKSNFGGEYYLPLHLTEILKMNSVYDQRPTEINISPKTLVTEEGGSVYGIIPSLTGGGGFLPTVAHEPAHASKSVNYNLSYQPWINEGHDSVWRIVYVKFFYKLQQKYGEQVKNRFKELRKIRGKEESKY